MARQVSVIVPFFNPGTSIEACIQSLLGQSMPADGLELIFVDDGSTDASPERLRALAASYPHVRVVTIEHSGWPGRPRNVGIDLAGGEYVMFVDHDDTLEPQALERMYGLGRANGADVVLGKVISDFRRVNHVVFREPRARCDVDSAPLLNSLTPHKMLRTEFLRRRQIRFPEGPRRLEDQHFMVRAYFAAASVSIVADYVCYRYLRRPDGQNVGSARIEPARYYANLREVLDVIDDHTVPGDRRDGFYARFLRSEILGRLSGRGLSTSAPHYLSELHREARALLEERFPPSVDARAGTALRGAAALVRSGTIEEIIHQSQTVTGLRVNARLTGIAVGAGRGFEIAVQARLELEGQPLRLEAVDGGGWRLPRALTGPVVTDDERLVEPAADMTGDVVIQHHSRRDEWFLPGPLRCRIEPAGDGGEIVWSGTAVLDPAHAAGGNPVRPGRQDLHVRVHAFGLVRSGRLGSGLDLVPAPLPVDGLAARHRIYATDRGHVSLTVRAEDVALRERPRRAARVARVARRRLRL